ncbi:hypothetical protein Btru_062892 [Bulinus truncatus]|nr:hypothetical protein Btru_062892 [Bulinus truncatus]
MNFMSTICGLGLAFLFPIPKSQGVVCPEPFEVDELEGHVECLYKSAMPLTWSAARKVCRDKKGDLATINSWSKFMVLLRGRDTAWIGLYRHNEHSPFMWVSEDMPLKPAFARQIFINGQPDNWGGRENCVVVDRLRGGLNDMPCHFPLRFICQFGSNQTEGV